MTSVPPALAEALEGRYRFERELGHGGMATVYLARDLKHDRLVAVKVLRPELTPVLGSERFLREIRLTAQLQHPHILSLLDSGNAGGLLYYVMPYIEGETLRERLVREGQLPIDDALGITTALAGALDFAHHRGVIHRDIKPENILLHHGEPMIADFGVALAAASAGPERLTETGLSLGTPAYMSPEQASGASSLDGRSDQYSLACVLYEMLAGEPPFTGRTAQAIIAKRFSEPVPHLSTVRSVTPAVERSVTRALSRSPADRYRTVGDFASALARKPSRAVSHRTAALLGGTLLLAVIALIAWMFRPLPRPITTHRQLTFSGQARDPAVSPDGRWLAYVLGDPPPSQRGERILVQDLTSSTAATVAATAPVLRFPSWESDGSRLFYAAVESTAYGIYAVSPRGGAARRVATGVVYTETGHAVYSSAHGDSVVTADVATGARKNAYSLSPTADYVGTLAASPNGRWLAFVGIKASTTFLGISDIGGSRARRLADGVPRWGSLAWAPAGDAIYYLRDLGNGANVAAAGDVMKIRIDSRSGAVKGPPNTVLGGAFVRSFGISADGRDLVYTKAPPQQKIWTMALHGPLSSLSVEARELTAGTSIHGTPDISPDGKSVAFARNDGGAGNIYVTPFESYAPRALTNSAADEWSPRWSPDGARIAFTTRDMDTPGVLVLETGSGQIRRISSDAVAPLGSITWSPDGQYVLFPLDLGRHYALVNVATGAADTLTAPDSVWGFRQTVFSSDGRDIAVNVWGHGGNIELWRGKRSGTNWTRLDAPQHTFPLLWTKDDWIYSLSGDNSLWRVPARGGAAKRLLELPQPCSDWEIAVSANARRLVCTVSRSEPDIWMAENFDPQAD